MRDIALTLVFICVLPVVLKHPVVGAYLWAWLSMMNPHKLTYGFAYNLPFAQITAVVTMLAFFFTRKRQPLPMNSIMVFYLALIAWMTLSSLFAMAPQAMVLDRWVFVMKIHVMLLVSLMLVVERRHLWGLIAVVACSVGFYGVKGGVWTLLQGGGGRVWGPPGGMIEGNNELAVALIIALPFLYFLHHVATRRWVRYALVGSMIAITFSVLGSQSRGALLALLAMAFFLGLKGKHPVRTSLGLLVLGALAIAFMPQVWVERMETIRTFDEDTSATSRIWTWITMWRAALDNPLFGAGFAADDPGVFAMYAPKTPEYAHFAGHVYVAHSIYFQMMGEHGFVGLALFLMLGLLTWRTASKLSRQMRDDAEFGPWMPVLMRMVQVSIVGYAVGGAFLSLAYFDMPYYVIAFVVICEAMVRRRATARKPLPLSPTLSDPSHRGGNVHQVPSS